MRPSVLAVAFLWAGQSFVHAAASRHLTLAPKSSISLTGDSTVHPFTCRTNEINLTADVNSAEGAVVAPTAIVAGILQKKALTRFDLSVPVISLKSKESTLDKNMYKAMNAQECPTIDFHMASYDVSAATSPTSALPVRATGTLRIACQERPVTLDGSLAPGADTLVLQGQYTLLMTDYGVKPPSLMLGAMKVRDPVLIDFNLGLIASNATPPGR